MATPEPSSKRTPTRSKVEFEPPSELAKYLPYLAAAAGFGVLVLTVTRSARYGVYAATALLAIAFLGLAYVAWEHTTTLPDGDRLRPMLRAVTVAVLLATVGPAAITLHPPAPQSVVQLTRPGGERARGGGDGGARGGGGVQARRRPRGAGALRAHRGAG